ncbi:MAG: hypothetical protein ABIZ50_03620 [Solirubrobacterales bacterium]
MTNRATKPSRGTLRLTVAAMLLSVLVALVAVASAPGIAADVLGQAAGKAPPSCPTPTGATGADPKTCFTFARVTGFQMSANGERALFKVPADGTLVAWSVDLAMPSQSEQAAFTVDQKLGEPSARIAVLKDKGKSQFKLTKQSPKVELSPELGREPIFTLDKPLKVKAGNVIALSTYSWVPDLAHNGTLTADGDLWRASRNRDRCGDDPNKTSEENTADLKKSVPQRKIGTVRTYGCTYGPARILYQAYYVPN